MLPELLNQTLARRVRSSSQPKHATLLLGHVRMHLAIIPSGSIDGFLYLRMADFSRIAPYLANPLVFAAFCLFVLSGVFRVLAQKGLLAKLSQKQSATLLRLGLVGAFVTLILGVALAVSRYHDNPIIQQTGACGSNIAGDNNKVDQNCADNPEGPKTK
ncbi:MAG: hypothetical protein ABR973_06245 [Candidatus Acidiferrales bacterium]